MPPADTSKDSSAKDKNASTQASSGTAAGKDAPSKDAGLSSDTPNSQATADAVRDAHGAGGGAGLRTGAGEPPPNPNRTHERPGLKTDAARRAEEKTDEAAKADKSTKPAGQHGFGHNVTGKTPPSAAETMTDTEETRPAPALNADVNVDPREAAAAKKRAESGQDVRQDPIRRAPYDLQKVHATANQSVSQDEGGRWVIQFPKEVNTDGFADLEKNPDGIQPGTTFATRDLAYKAAVRLLKTSSTFAR